MTDKKIKKKPVYIRRLPLCNNACPLGNNIQKWIMLTKQNKLKEAWEVLMENNPLPASLGRVCYHPCETACNRRTFDASVNINGIERFLGDKALENDWSVSCKAKKIDKKILVVGAGPAGLSAAYHLTLLGYEVSIYESSNVGGGMMHYGIPSYRLPRDILDKEVERIEKMGVKIEYKRKVKDLMEEKNKGNFDAVFIAVGSATGRMIDIPQTGKDCKIVDAIAFLKDVENKKMARMDENKVVVYGGGNTSIDVVRSAIRLGAKDVSLVYRRNREKMPALDFEVAEALEEGMILRVLRSIKEIHGKDVLLDIMDLDRAGWPQFSGRQETIQADTLILALGLDVDTKFLRKINGMHFNQDGTIFVDKNMMTSCDGIFAGGDVVPFDRSVATAVGHGKKAASAIDSFLSGKMRITEKPDLATSDKLDKSYYKKADRKERSQIEFDKRVNTFEEVMHGFNETEVMHEADRCFSCGNCFECDTCYNACPVKAITKLGEGRGYAIDYDKCINCGLCVRKCPCGSIEMILKEEIFKYE